MKKSTPSAAVVPAAIVEDAWQDVSASFERFCLTAGLATLSTMMEEDAVHLCGPRYGRADSKTGHRWGTTKGKVGFHGGKVEIERPRVRARDGGELVLPSWESAMSEDLLGRWALNLMLINVSTRKFGRAVRLPGGDIAAPKGAGVTKSAVSRRFVALSAERMKEWMAADLSKLDLLVIQIDGIHIKEDLMLLAAVGIDGDGRQKTSARRDRGGDGERCRGAGPARQLGWARPRPGDLPPVHHRRRQGAVQGDPQHLRSPHPDPAVVRCTRPATSPSVFPSPFTPACARPCARLGNWTTPTRPKS